MRTRTPSKKTLTDQASELVEQVTPHVEAARDKIVNDYLPVAQSVLADAAVTAREVAQDAAVAAQEKAATLEKSTRKSRKDAAKKAKEKARQAAKAAAATPAAVAVANKVKPEPEKSGRKKWFFLLAILGAGAVVLRRMAGSSAPSTPAYAPPRPVADPVTPSATPSATPPAPPASHFEPDASDLDSEDLDTEETPDTDDAGGASPGEALADANEQPQGVTTPDQPVQVEDVAAKNRDG